MSQERPTHRKLECDDCGTVIWIPLDILGPQTDHSERLFHECDEQGSRMDPVDGPDRFVAL